MSHFKGWLVVARTLCRVAVLILLHSCSRGPWVAAPRPADQCTRSTNAHSSSRTVDVRCFGAAGDGEHDDAPAFRAAFAAIAPEGGEVRVSPGTYLLASLGNIEHMHVRYAMELCDRCVLRLQSGSVVKLADDFINLSNTLWGSGVVLATNKQGVGVVGPGEFDLNGNHNLVRQGDLRPGYTIKFFNCKDQSVRGLTFRNSSGRDVIFLTGDMEGRPGDRALVLGNTIINGGTSITGNRYQDDFSAIYVDSTNSEIAHNRILHEAYPSTYSGGIEIHNSVTHCHHNYIEKSLPGIYIASDHPGKSVQAVTVNDNRIVSSIIGVQITGVGRLQDVRIENNEIGLHPFLSSSTYPAFGIRHMTDYDNTLDAMGLAHIDGYVVRNNRIWGEDTFIPRFATTYGMKIAGVSNAEIVDNRIGNLSGDGILVWGSPGGFHNVALRRNYIVDFGQNSSAHAHSAHVLNLAGSASNIGGRAMTGFGCDGLAFEAETAAINRPLGNISYSAYHAEWSENAAVLGLRSIGNHLHGVSRVAVGSRAMQLIVRTLERNAVRPRITADNMDADNTSPTAVVDLVGGVPGQSLMLRLDSHTTLVHGVFIRTRDQQNVTASSSNQFIALVRSNDSWIETWRSF